jgi:fucose permease
MATKTSILIFYLRMAKNTQLLLKTASYITLAIVNIAGVVLTFLNAFQCSPVTAAYVTSTHGNCISIVTLYLCSAPVNIITDLAILVLPIPVLTGMRLPQRQKTVLVFTFALGIFVTIIDVVRIYYLQQADDIQDMLIVNKKLGTSTGIDFAWTASTALMWSAVEVNVGIICACIPTLKPLIKKLLPSMITDHSHPGTEKTASFSDSQAYHGPSVAAGAVQPLPPAQVGGNQEEQMGMMDFLTTPGMNPAEMEAGLAQSNTMRTAATENTVYFGFIDMRRPKSMLKTRGWESFKYCTVVTILFFLWGFSYGLLNTLNTEIAKIAGESTSQTLGLTSAYFGAYFLGPLTVGQWVLRHGGFKATFISGLCIYGTGTLMFWPSAVLTSYPGFIISQFVVGFGLSVLETAANPFLALCGPAQYAECRLLLAQGVQGASSVLSQLLAQRVFFPAIAKNLSLIDVQWTYLAIALFTVILALFFYYMPLPEATDADLQSQSDTLSIRPSTPLFNTKLPLIYTTLALACTCQFLYVGAQESLSIWSSNLFLSLSPEASLVLTLNDYAVLWHAVFAIGRFAVAPLCLFIPPRILLATTFLLGTIVAIVIVALDHPSGNAIAGPVTLLAFFEGPIWPLVFAIGLRGMGAKTKYAAAGITAGASGGAIFPFVMWAVQGLDGRSVQASFSVIIALFAAGMLFPIYLNLVPGAREQVDPLTRASFLGEVREEERPESPAWRRFSLLFKQGKRSGESGGARVEHREREERRASERSGGSRS